ncbi:MAG: ornithine carbamoyltransferase [Candidatus Thermoplasmatota archaeon]|nr:ornithine carbamoyltransferase [Candidatus Thermoplasmatota archaeon]
MSNTEKRNLLSIDDLIDDLDDIINWAIRYKNDISIHQDFKPLEGMSIGSIYEKPSTRTRVSFEVGVSRLGGQPLTLLANDIQLGKSESIGDTAAVLSRYLDGITYRCFGHADVEELARTATVPVINALSDLHHPCQSAADLMAIREHSNSEGHIAWVGDGNNVFHDLALAGLALGYDVKYATPVGMEPNANVLSRCEEIASTTGAEITGSNDPVETVKNAAVIYTDIFVSMGEEHMTDKFAAFEGFQVNEELVAHAQPDYVFMHCLPAHRGEEVTDAVIDSRNSIVLDQAENRMWAQMSILTYLCNNDAWHAYNEM